MCNSRFCVLTSFLFIFSQPKKKMIVVPEIASELVGLLIWKLLNLMDMKMKLFICTDPLDVRLVVVVVSSNRWKSILHLELWLDQLNKNGNYIYNSKSLYTYILAKIRWICITRCFSWLLLINFEYKDLAYFWENSNWLADFWPKVNLKSILDFEYQLLF